MSSRNHGKKTAAVGKTTSAPPSINVPCLTNVSVAYGQNKYRVKMQQNSSNLYCD